MPYLPKLIFTDHHHNPITGKVLKALAPRLEVLGYEVFYDEAAEKTSANDVIERANDIEAKMTAFAKYISTEYQLDINDPAIFKHDFFVNGAGKNTVELIKRFRADMSCRDFVKTLAPGAYHAMDLEIMKQSLTEADLPALHKSRDIHMASALINATKALYARIGLLHAEGIQKEILEKNKNLPEAEIKAGFCFFNIYTPQSLTTKVHNDVLKDKVNLPLGLVSIDASAQAIDKTVQMILDEIKIKSDKLNGFALKNKVKFHTTEEKAHKIGFFSRSEMNLSGFSHIVEKNNKKAFHLPPLSSSKR